MKIQVVKCDICGSEKDVSAQRLPVFKLHDSTDGRSWFKHPVVDFKVIDICPECLMKCTNIYNDTVMGHVNFLIVQNPELNARKEK